MRKPMVVGGAILTILLAGVLAICLIPTSSQRVVRLVTYVDHPVLNTIQTSFKKHLDELSGSGTVQILESNANGRAETLPDLARQVLGQKPAVLLTLSTPVTQAVMRLADSDQPLVFTFVTNPSDLGDELTRTNSSGLSDAVNYSANVELLREVFGPDVTIGMIYNPTEANSVFGIQAVENVIKGSTTKLVKVTVTSESDIPMAAAQLAGVVRVIYVGGDNTVVGAIPALLRAAVEKKVPVFASDVGSIEAGAVAGVSVDYEKLGRQTAEMVNKVLGGIAPRSIPRVVLAGDMLIVNSGAAKRFGVTLPDAVLKRVVRTINN